MPSIHTTIYASVNISGTSKMSQIKKKQFVNITFRILAEPKIPDSSYLGS